MVLPLALVEHMASRTATNVNVAISQSAGFCRWHEVECNASRDQDFCMADAELETFSPAFASNDPRWERQRPGTVWRAEHSANPMASIVRCFESGETARITITMPKARNWDASQRSARTTSGLNLIVRC